MQFNGFGRCGGAKVSGYLKAGKGFRYPEGEDGVGRLPPAWPSASVVEGQHAGHAVVADQYAHTLAGLYGHIGFLYHRNRVAAVF